MSDYAILTFAVRGLPEGFSRPVEIVHEMDGILVGNRPCSPVKMSQETWDQAKETAANEPEAPHLTPSARHPYESVTLTLSRITKFPTVIYTP